MYKQNLIFITLCILIVENLFLSNSTHATNRIQLPDSLNFAGQNVPLNDPFVKEHFDVLFTTMTYNQKGQLLLWYRRSNRYIPTVKKILTEKGLPTDLAYIMVAESDLLPRALSPSNAYGIWQFIPSTGQYYGLEKNQGLDERGDFFKATEKAISYLQKLYADFNKDWFLAMAAYNCGPTNIRKMLNVQNGKTYWDCVPIKETNIYVPRIILIKTFFENPALFGVSLEDLGHYPPIEYVQIRFRLENSLPMAEICNWVNVNYRTIHALNPHFYTKSYLEDAVLPANKPLFINLPKGKNDLFGQSLNEFNQSVKVKK